MELYDRQWREINYRSKFLRRSNYFELVRELIASTFLLLLMILISSFLNNFRFGKKPKYYIEVYIDQLLFCDKSSLIDLIL
jgi:hypothetical protein